MFDLPEWRGKPAIAVLPRKEVIQPQVPLRLPCYDFIPITKFTFGRVIADFGCSRLS